MKFRKKPVVIEAEQYDADKAHHLSAPFYAAVCRGWEDPTIASKSVEWYNALGIKGDRMSFPFEDRAALPHIHTLEGSHIVSDHDWIIRGVKGEFYPCKPDIFEQTYEAA